MSEVSHGFKNEKSSIVYPDYLKRFEKKYSIVVILYRNGEAHHRRLQGHLSS